MVSILGLTIPLVVTMIMATKTTLEKKTRDKDVSKAENILACCSVHCCGMEMNGSACRVILSLNCSSFGMLTVNRPPKVPAIP